MKAGDCRHFTGYQNGKCEAGICYREIVGGEDLGWAARLPCLPSSKLRKDSVTCSSFDPKTHAEEIAEAFEFKVRFEKITEARKHIIATGQKRGTVECPKCEKRLNFSIASNGHVWANCETAECLSWME